MEAFQCLQMLFELGNDFLPKQIDNHIMVDEMCGRADRIEA